MKRLNALATIVLFACAISLSAAKTTRLTVKVTSAKTGKGVDRASVIVRFDKVSQKKAKTSGSDLETKTAMDGSVMVPLIPKGDVQIQVIAPNYQTFGNTFVLDQDEQTIEIKLDPPKSQYSEAEKRNTIPQ